MAVGRKRREHTAGLLVLGLPNSTARFGAVASEPREQGTPMPQSQAIVKVKKKCCKSRPRCKRCPVVLKRLEGQGLAERQSKRRYELSPSLKKRQLKGARQR
jgi:hypothetical protein